MVRSGAHAVTSNVKTSRTAVAQPASTGIVNWSRIVAPEDLRQDRSGPTPVKKSRQSPIGTIHRLKNAGPTFTSLPVTALKSDGKRVAKVTKKAAASSTQ